LIRNSRCLDQPYPSLLSRLDLLVHTLGIAPQPSEGVKESILVREIQLLVVRVSVRLSLVDAAVEYFDSVTVENGDISSAELDQVIEVDAPV
jgi:hypothetical protein